MIYGKHLTTSNARLTSNFATNSGSYQTALNVSITPIQSNSHILVVVTGSGAGHYGGTSSGSQASGYVTVYKNGAPWTGLETFLTRGNPTFPTPISQIILDTGPAAGASVSYQVMLKKWLGNGSGVSPTVRHSTSITLIEFMV